jgi:hypothetical protein
VQDVHRLAEQDEELEGVSGPRAEIGADHSLKGASQLPRPAAQSQLLTALAWCTGLMCLSLAPFAAYLWRLGAKVVLHAQLPLPGARVLRDTPIIRGEAARRRGRWLQGLAVALLACGIALAVVAWRLHVLLSSGA